MRIALFGGTGFVGYYLVDDMLQRGHDPVLLVRPGSESKVRSPEKCRIISGEIADPAAVEGTLEGADAAIYCIGILRQFPRRGISFEELHFQGARTVIQAAEKLAVQRFILMSANGVVPDGTGYQKTKHLAEQYLRNSSLDWTIFRPSLIFGDPRGRIDFCTQLRDQLIRLPLPGPLFYKGLIPRRAGSFQFSPVHVQNVTAFFIKSLTMESTVGRTIELGGPATLDWKSVIKTIGRASGKKKWTIPVPVLGVYLLAALLDRWSFFPLTREQLTMLLEGNTCDSSKVFEEFGLEALPFSIDNLDYLSGQP